MIDTDCGADVPTLLAAVKTGVKLPVADGVPARPPVFTFKVTPAGRLPLDSAQEVGLPLAVIIYVKA